MTGGKETISRDMSSLDKCKFSLSMRKKSLDGFGISNMFSKMLIIPILLCIQFTRHGFAARSGHEGNLGIFSKEFKSSLLLESQPRDQNVSTLANRNEKLKYRRLLDTNRIADMCTMSDISVFQGHSSPLPNGIPTYTVQIINLCVIGCPLSNIHVACGWFASAKLVNPQIFRRIKYNDCLVNDGKPIKGGDSISFQYANSFEYPMRVATAETCGRP
ncbi:hypothetical protein O6H91_07G003800 [Diphasiastrum complanatum]|uniref:Uncharacterized protein n=1 Tax=Diphasiastrum complanatum TaxID=34168 RepID=A0ACC2D2N1_DIPCM|nr:hypothetical protein O6H91_07G003800 [Diphasiastrum complanatum]